jgi:hypothetical protein
MKTGTKFTIKMEVKKDGVRATVTLDGDKKTYFFSFDVRRNEASRIDLLISYLPRKFYVDALLEHTK